jgi:hypothetical protein
MTKPDPSSSQPTEQEGKPASALVRLVRALAKAAARSFSGASCSDATAADREAASEPGKPEGRSDGCPEHRNNDFARD